MSPVSDPHLSRTGRYPPTPTTNMSPEIGYDDSTFDSSHKQTPLTPPSTPPLPPRPTLPLRKSVASASTLKLPALAESLQSLQDEADFPPLALPPQTSVSGACIVLYLFRVPGTGDFCLSLAKPLRHLISEVDILLSLYYVKIDADGVVLLLRNKQVVAKVVNGTLEMFGAGYQKFGVSHCDDDGSITHQVKTWNDAQGFTYWTSPWGGRCVFEVDNSSQKTCCRHLRKGMPPSKSENISSLKLHLPTSASKKLKMGFSKTIGGATTQMERLSQFDMTRPRSSVLSTSRGAPSPKLSPHTSSNSASLSPEQMKAESIWQENHDISTGLHEHVQLSSTKRKPLSSHSDQYNNENETPRTSLHATSTTESHFATNSSFRDLGRRELSENPLGKIHTRPLPIGPPPALPPRLPLPPSQPQQDGALGRDEAKPFPDLASSDHDHYSSLNIPSSKRWTLPEGMGPSNASTGRPTLPPRHQTTQLSPEHGPVVKGFELPDVEKPGGDFQKGKKAKLAKIEIWGAGLQMLDMVVAANLVMFMKAYKVEHSSGKLFSND